MTTELRVLLAEDDEHDARLIVAALRAGGFEPAVRPARTEAEFRAALTPDLDVVLADDAVPHLGAARALELLAEAGLDVPLIVVSGATGEELAVEALHRGAADYLLKDRLGRLGQAVARARAERRLRAAHRTAEQELRESRRILRTVIDAIPLGVFWKDRRGRYLGCNRHFADAFGLARPEDVAGRTDHDLPGLKRDEAEFLALTDRHVIETDSGRFGVVAPATFPGGRAAWLETSRIPLHDDAGRVGGVLGVWQDITRRVRLEEQARRAQKMEAVGRLAGGVAHDFNNLLTVINGYADLLLARAPAGDPGRELVAQIAAAGARAAALTRQLLAFSRKAVLKPAVVDLNALVAEMAGLLKPLLGPAVDLEVRPGPGLWPVKVDPGEMGQVIMNLCVNARDAMPGGGRLTIETANVELGAEDAAGPAEARAGEHVLLAVSDTGSGMDADTRARIFEPFFTTKEQGKGTGLGLATVDGLVRQSGGHVAVDSEPGRGSTFKVYLPRDRSGAAPARPAPAAPAPAPRGTETVLLAEDDAAVRQLARLVLQEGGYAVLEAAGGEEALRLAAGPAPVRLLVTDVVMPGLGGPRLAERLRRLRPELKVLYLSGYADETVARHGLLEPGAPFLQKPFSPDALARKVREVLDG